MITPKMLYECFIRNNHFMHVLEWEELPEMIRDAWARVLELAQTQDKAKE